MHYFYSYRSLKYKIYKDEKDFATMENYSLVANNNDENYGQVGQALGWFFKKDSALNERGQ